MTKLLQIFLLLLLVYIGAKPLHAGVFDEPANVQKIFFKQHDAQGNRVFDEDFLNKRLQEYEALNDSSNIFFSYLGLSFAYAERDKSEMINYIIKAYPFIPLSRKAELTPYLKLTEAISYYQLGKYSDANNKFFKLNTAFSGPGEEPLAILIIFYNSLCHAVLGKHAEALQLFEGSKIKTEKLKSIDPEVLDLIQLNAINIEGLIYLYNGENDKAAAIFGEGVKKAKKINDGRMLMNLYGTLSNIYLYNGQYQLAIDYARIELNYSRRKSDFRSLFALSGILAQSFHSLGANDSTIKYIDKIIELMPTSYDSYFNESNQNFLLDYYYQTNQPKKLIETAKFMSQIRDSLNLIRVNRDYELIRSQIDLDGAQNQIDQLKKINLLENQKSAAVKKYNVALIIGLFGILLLVYFIYKNLTEKRNQNIALERKNVEINNKNEELITQQEDIVNQTKRISELNALLEEKLDERTKEIFLKNKKLIEYAFYNSHNIRGPLARILGIINLWENGHLQMGEKEKMLANINISALELDEMIKKMNRMLE